MDRNPPLARARLNCNCAADSLHNLEGRNDSPHEYAMHCIVQALDDIIEHLEAQNENV